uniref:hypothetical protein n=1 Tax=Bartonella sp. CL34QHWL TaxID=3243526 RepID=UPI0035CF87E1
YQRSLSPIEEEELDHVLPIKEFKDKPELCFAWFNMRPMEKTENRQKSATVDYTLFKDQLDRSMDFMVKMRSENWFVFRDQNVIPDWKTVISQHFGDYLRDENMILLNKLSNLNNNMRMNQNINICSMTEIINEMIKLSNRLERNLLLINFT